jgi:hypothetical protein
MNDCVLGVEYGDMTLFFDFMARVVITQYHGYEKGGVSTVPFSQMDRNALTRFRDELVQQAGHPPELQDSEPAQPPAAPTLSL